MKTAARASPAAAIVVFIGGRASGAGLAALLFRVNHQRLAAAFHDLGVDHHLFHALQGGKLEHGLQQDAFQDGTQPACAGPAQDGALGDGMQRLFLEAQLDAFHLEHPLILLGQGILGPGENFDQGSFLQVDTTNILFICGGAFAGLDKIISARTSGTSMGFGANVKGPDERGTGEILRVIEPEDLLKFGLIPEFIGRLPVLATLGDLSEPALIEILTRPKNALAKQYMRMFEMEGVKLRFQEEALHSISRRAIMRKTGARGLRSILEGILLETMFELPTLNGVQEVVITADVVDGKARPLYTYSDKGQPREQTAS